MHPHFAAMTGAQFRGSLTLGKVENLADMVGGKWWPNSIS